MNVSRSSIRLGGWSLSLIFLAALCLPSALPGGEARERRIIADFEDAGTWRVVANSGSAPGAWFSGVVWMGGSQNARFADDRVGELRFDFAGDAPARRRLAFRRAKMSQVSGFLDGIEFDADSRGHPVSLRFVLLDSAKKRHMTPPLRLGPEGWRRHRLALDAGTWPAVKDVRFPAAVEQVVLESDEGGAGSVFIDDLALTGSFTRKDRLSAAPVYSAINYEPGAPVALDYRVRSASGSPVKLKAGLRVTSFSGAQVFAGRATAEVEAHGQARLRFAVPPLPAGAYAAMLGVEGVEGAEGAGARVYLTYEDTFGVFTPNGGRVNRRPMWFGVQDGTIWQGEGENRLHLGWMKEIGIDLNRVQMTPGRFAGGRSLDGWRTLLQPFEDAGIDTCLLYFETPAALLPKGGNPRMPPNDLEAFEYHAADVGAFFGSFPRVRYVEFWNEPDINFFNGTLEEYWGMLAAFSRGLRSAAPRIKLATGGSTVKHGREKQGFNRSLYSENGPLYDVAAFHAHGPLASYVERQRLVEGWQAEGGLEKPIANTESGERSGFDIRGRAEQARTLVKKLAYAKSRPRSEFYVWYTLQDSWDMDPENGDSSFGLVTSDNRAKPSLVACNELIRQLANTDPAPAPEFPPGVTGHAFARDDGRHVLVCWARDGAGGGVLWIQSGGETGRVDMFGLSEPLALASGGAVFVGKDPVYLVSDTPLRFLAEGERPLEAPAEIYRDAGEQAEFAVTVRNIGPGASEYRLTLRDVSGAAVWSDARRLETGARTEFPVKAPPAPEAGMASARYLLELDSGGGDAPLSLPVLLQGSYGITRENPRPVTLDTAQDVHELTFDPTIPAWKGPRDLSVEARIGRDDHSVIFRFAVTDDRHVQTHPDNQLWRGDSVQVAFYNPGNGAHTLFDLGLRGGKAIAWCNKNADTTLEGRWTIPLGIHRESTRTIYEARIPFAHLGLPSMPPLAMPVRFSFLVNEDDGQGRVRWMRWRGGLGNNRDIQQLGYGILK